MSKRPEWRFTKDHGIGNVSFRKAITEDVRIGRP